MESTREKLTKTESELRTEVDIPLLCNIKVPTSLQTGWSNGGMAVSMTTKN